MKVMQSLSYHVTALLLLLGFQCISTDELKENYERCLNGDVSKLTPRNVYLECFNARTMRADDKTTPKDQCLENYQHQLTCLESLMNVLSSCIDEENKKTLQTLKNVQLALMDKECTADLTDAVIQSVVECGGSHVQNISKCSFALVNIEPRFESPETLAGFSYNSTYCNILRDYNACEKEGFKTCTQDAIKTFEVRRSARWTGTGCSKILNGDSNNSSNKQILISLLIILAAIGNLIIYV